MYSLLERRKCGFQIVGGQTGRDKSFQLHATQRNGATNFQYLIGSFSMWMLFSISCSSLFGASRGARQPSVAANRVHT